MNYFSDETENGLLFINYPMIESYRDYNKNISKYTNNEFKLLFLQNVMKANYIVFRQYSIPTYEEFVLIVHGY